MCANSAALSFAGVVDSAQGLPPAHRRPRHVQQRRQILRRAHPAPAGEHPHVLNVAFCAVSPPYVRGEICSVTFCTVGHEGCENYFFGLDGILDLHFYFILSQSCTQNIIIFCSFQLKIIHMTFKDIFAGPDTIIVKLCKLVHVKDKIDRYF